MGSEWARAARGSAFAISLVIGAAMAGCDSSSVGPGPCWDCLPPPPIPKNDTPLHALQRLVFAMEEESPLEYVALFTSDFRFEFSEASDPPLVTLYGDSWNKGDETAFLRHLLQGFVSSTGAYVPGSGSIAMRMDRDTVFADPAHADSTRFYAYCPVYSMQLMVDVSDTSGVTSFEINAPQDLYLVRGDAAVLDAGQPADSLHWYIHHWDDLSPPPPAGGTAGQVPTTWGRLKARYR